jgi:hypothetical protein
MREDRENLIIANAELRMLNYNTAVLKFSEPSVKASDFQQLIRHKLFILFRKALDSLKNISELK